jgi:outer membrane receptor protein involved in Fe transport
MNEILVDNPEIFEDFHQETQEYMDSYVGQFGNSFLIPGTPEFQEAFDEITSQTRYDEQGNLVGGTMFYDRSKLYHAHAEYKFDIGLNKFVIGANARMYAPNSNGSIFNDGYIQTYENIYALDDEGNQIINFDTTLVNISTNPFLPEFVEIIDSTYVFTIDTIVEDISISNKEFGVYMGYNRDFLSETLKLAGSVRMDKNQNFDYLISPAASIVYTPSEKDVVRVSLSSAIRNPTLTDQYLNYDAGRGILLGNLNGFGFDQYFANLDSLEQYFIGEYVNPNALLGGLLQITPIRPEKVKTIEIGYRTTLFNKLYVDASAYFSKYTDFIGYQSGASFRFGSTMVSDSTDILNGWADAIGDTIDNYRDLSYSSIQPYRLAANASEKVTTQGFTIGLNYFLSQSITLNANYSYNKLNKSGTDDPIIPAYNTPEHKYNIGVSGRDINLLPNSPNWGFSINYKWVEGFVFEGSPQFTGLVPTYSQLDAQINKLIPAIYSTLKIGASNLLNNFTYQVYGGPRVGRMVYVSLQIDIK